MRRLTSQIAKLGWALCFAFSAIPALAQDRVSSQGATISANGNAFAKEDRAWVQIQVTAQEKEPAAALDAHAASFKTMLDRLAAKGIASDRIETGQLAIQPRYEVKRDGNRDIRGPLIGYVVFKTIFIFFDDPALVAAFVADLPLSGPARVVKVGHYMADGAAVGSAAIADGVSRAMAGAVVAARATNRKVGGVTGLSLSINDHHDSKPRVVGTNQWQQFQIQTPIDEQLQQRLILEPGEARVNQGVTLYLQLR